MKALGVQRVVIVVRDLDKAVELYSRLLGVSFLDISAASEPMGVRVAINWDAGLEICTPIQGRDSFVAQFLQKRGEGVVWVVFSFDGVDQAHVRAQEIGIGVAGLLDFNQDQIDEYFQGIFSTYKEYMLNRADTCGTGVILGNLIESTEIEPVDCSSKLGRVCNEEYSKGESIEAVERL